MKLTGNLQALSDEAKQLAEAKIIRSEEAREILTLVRRLIETLELGEPKTPRIPRHHV